MIAIRMRKGTTEYVLECPSCGTVDIVYTDNARSAAGRFLHNGWKPQRGLWVHICNPKPGTDLIAAEGSAE